MEKTREKFKDRRILIWGYGREGKSTERFLTEYCEPASIEIYEGGRDGVRDAEYDYVFVSPGIRFEEDAPAFDNGKFTSQTEVFLEEYGAQTIGITGTKGKSTTCSLLYAALSACSARKIFLMGNIGKPCFDYLAEMDGESLAVFELSCHQCQRLQAAPHIAVFLNLYGDHLDRYLTMEHYWDAKCGITRHQTPEDVLLLGPQVPEPETKARVLRLNADGSSGERGPGGRSPEGNAPSDAEPTENIPLDAEPAEKDSSAEACGRNSTGDAGKNVRNPEKSKTRFALRIPGEHNQFNAGVVCEIAVGLLGCEEEPVRKGMSTFPGLPHRLEHCGTVCGVDYYDDSISTIPQATIQAVSSVPHAKTVLVGGMDRGVDYGVLESFIREHPEMNFILAYASGERILRELGEDAGLQGEAALSNVFYAEDLAAQVKLAKRITPAGFAVVMSNAAASYGYFRDFEARGEAFKQLIVQD